MPDFQRGLLIGPREEKVNTHGKRERNSAFIAFIAFNRPKRARPIHRQKERNAWNGSRDDSKETSDGRRGDHVYFRKLIFGAGLLGSVDFHESSMPWSGSGPMVSRNSTRSPRCER